MTTPQSSPAFRVDPAHQEPFRFPMYTPEFAADPHAAYRKMRCLYPSLVPVELSPGVPATLVISHATAVQILNDPDHFPADPRKWQAKAPADAPVLAMMGWHPAARFNTGPLHARYRDASVAGIDGVDLYGVLPLIESIAIPLINRFCATGSADLMTDYAFPLVLEIINRICGAPAEIGKRVADGSTARFDQRSTVTAQEGMKMIKDALMDLIHLKRAHPEPGKDATSRLVTHPADLSDVEVFANLMSFYGAGFELQRNLITNTLLLMLTDPRYAAFAADGRNLSTITALDEVLFNDPPMANFCTTYPKQPIMVDGIWLESDQPVLISLAACNNDPHIRVSLDPGGSHFGNRSHLAWSVGPHACPAKPLAYEIAQNAIDYLLSVGPDMSPAVPVDQLVWRPGPFHRALVALPVVFDPLPPMPVT